MQSFVNDTKTGQIFLSNKMSIFHGEYLTSGNTKKEKMKKSIFKQGSYRCSLVCVVHVKLSEFPFVIAEIRIFKFQLKAHCTNLTCVTIL